MEKMIERSSPMAKMIER